MFFTMLVNAAYVVENKMVKKNCFLPCSTLLSFNLNSTNQAI